MINGIMIAAVIICVYTVIMQHITFDKKIDQLNKAFDKAQEPIEPVMVDEEVLTDAERQALRENINEIIEMVNREGFV